MIELPEAAVIADQITGTLSGKRIACAVANASPHRFAWFTGDPATYDDRLAGKVVAHASGVGLNVEIEVDDLLLAVSAPIHYHAQGEKRPNKHQLLLEFDDGTAITSCAQMWGGFLCFPNGKAGNTIDYDEAKNRPSPLTDRFDRPYFDSLFDEDTPKLSAKAFLATEQRIPGLGNGVLQDILWTARIHPKRRMGQLTPVEVDALYDAVKRVLAKMTAEGGRDTESDLFGRPGGYRTILSKNSSGMPCPVCGAAIRKESFMGGSIYSCPECQAV